LHPSWNTRGMLVDQEVTAERCRLAPHSSSLSGETEIWKGSGISCRVRACCPGISFRDLSGVLQARHVFRAIIPHNHIVFVRHNFRSELSEFLAVMVLPKSYDILPVTGDLPILSGTHVTHNQLCQPADTGRRYVRTATPNLECCGQWVASHVQGSSKRSDAGRSHKVDFSPFLPFFPNSLPSVHHVSGSATPRRVPMNM